MKNRVVVTGLGLLSPVGNDVSKSWDSVLNGRSGVQTVESFEQAGLATHFAATVKDFEASEYMERKDARKFDKFIQYGIAAASQAIKDSGIVITDSNAERVGVCVAAGIGGMPMIEDNHKKIVR